MSINANSNSDISHALKYLSQFYLDSSLVTLTQLPSPHLPPILCRKFLTIIPVIHGQQMPLVVVTIITILFVVVVIIIITYHYQYYSCRQIFKLFLPILT